MYYEIANQVRNDEIYYFALKVKKKAVQKIKFSAQPPQYAHKSLIEGAVFVHREDF